ncbi:MAG TPA: GTPase HflX, partial [Methyloceanibacter sp.]|nr:GTPase HflX [Methyloceanibacter sp.]
MRPTDPKALKRKERRTGRRSRQGPMRTLVLLPVLGWRGMARRAARGDAFARSSQSRLEEAVGLAAAIDLEVAASGLVPLEAPRPATLFGSGKVEEIAGLVRAEEVGLVV